jgi:hypothetical protein
MSLALGVRGVYTIVISAEKHWTNIEKLLKKYSNRPISVADACLIRCAEIHEEARIARSTATSESTTGRAIENFTSCKLLVGSALSVRGKFWAWLLQGWLLTSPASWRAPNHPDVDHIGIRELLDGLRVVEARAVARDASCVIPCTRRATSIERTGNNKSRTRLKS